MSEKKTDKLNYMAGFGGPIGYAAAARDMVAALLKLGVDVNAIPDGSPGNREEMSQIMGAFARPDDIDPEAVTVTQTVPRGLELSRVHGSKRFCYSVLETSTIPDTWVKNLNNMDGAITATKWGKKVYESCGVNSVDVVPHGVDCSRFSPLNLPLENVKDDNVTTFLCVSKFEHRKGYDVLLPAFAEEFADVDDVRLICVLHNQFIKDFNPYREIMSWDVNGLKNITLVDQPMPNDVLDRLYASVDAFVLPTRGEGWGLPITEAMASGLPVIATDWSGPTEYMTKDNSYKLKHMGMTKVPQNDMFAHILGDSEWAEPDPEHLKTLLRTIYDDKVAAKKVGEKARKDMMEKFSWKSAAKKMVKAVELS